MREYLLVFKENRVGITEKSEGFLKGGKKPLGILGIVEYPQLEEEVYLPVSYDLFSPDGPKIGEIRSWLPQEYQFKVITSSFLIDLFKVREELRLVQNNRVDGEKKTFEIWPLNLSPEKLREAKTYGFTHGWEIQRSGRQGEVRYYQKEGQKRALLLLDERLEWQNFIILGLLSEIESQLSAKKVKSEIIEVPPPPQVEKVLKEEEKTQPVSIPGERKESYRDFILSLPVIRQERAVEYIDQQGEWRVFCDFMDQKKPLLINGPTGNGKSTMIKWYANQRNLPYFKYTGHRDTTLKDLVGLWVPTDQKPIKAPGPLILAMVHGGIFHFEEIGPVSQDVLDGLHTILDDREIIIDSQYGFEKIKAHPNFRMVASGNLNRDYTLNELNSAFLERWVQIKLGYPDREKTVEILCSVTGVDKKIAERLTDITLEMRSVLKSHQLDFGLRGAVAVAEAIIRESELSLIQLIEVCMINPKATYDESDLRGQLRDIVEKHFGGLSSLSFFPKKMKQKTKIE